MDSEKLPVTLEDSGLPSFWGAEEKWVRGVDKVRANNRLKHGFAASIPIICRGHKCPYQEACYIEDINDIKGTRCPIEVATIIDLYRNYCAQLDIDPDVVDPKKHTVDLSLVNELISLDIKILRTQNKLAIDADFVQHMVVGITESGEAFTRPEIHQAEVLSEKLRRDRHKVFDMLLSTRKAKKMAGLGKDPSSQASNLLAQAQRMVEQGLVDKSVVGFLFSDGKGGGSPGGTGGGIKEDIEDAVVIDDPWDDEDEE